MIIRRVFGIFQQKATSFLRFVRVTRRMKGGTFNTFDFSSKFLPIFQIQMFAIFSLESRDIYIYISREKNIVKDQSDTKEKDKVCNLLLSECDAWTISLLRIETLDTMR